MRRKILIAALMGATSLTPMKAEAGVVAPLIIAVAASGAGAYVGAALTAAGYGAFAVAAGSALATVGVSYVGQSLLGQNGARQRAQSIAPSSRFANFAQPVSYAEWVFGRTRKGGPLAFTAFKISPDGNDARRHYAVILAAHQIQGVVTHYLDERIVTIDGSGNVQEPPIAGYCNIRTYRGTMAQAADGILAANFPEWTSAHDMTGLAYSALYATRPAPEAPFGDIYPSGRQWAHMPVIDGWDEIYDPRDDTTKWTDNAALVTAHVITRIFGQVVNWDSVAVEADAADARGWKINGTLSADQSYEDMRSALMVACDGHWFERPDGGVGFYVGRWIEPGITLTGRDFLTVEISEGTRDGNAPTEVAAQYSEPENGYRESVSGVIVFEAVAMPRRDELSLQLVTDHLQACKVCKRQGLIARAQYRLQGTIGLVGYELWAGQNGNPERFFRLQHAGLDRYFEIARLEKVGLAQFRIEARSVLPTDFDFDPSEEPEKPIRLPVTSADDVPDPSGVEARAIGNGAVKVEWTAQPGYLGQQVQIREQGTTDWSIYDVPADANFLSIRGLAATTSTPTYEVQLRNRTRGYRASDWVPETPVTVLAVANSTPPMELKAFAVTLSGANITVNLTPDASDPNYYATRIYRADYAPAYAGAFDFADAVLVRTENGIPSEADQWIDTGIAAGVYAYWGEPINISGVTDTALRSGPADAEIT